MRLILTVLLIFPSSLIARDINLDKIYIKNTSANFKKLMLEKLDTYQKLDAIFVDRDIIFAGWISGDEIIYIKESSSLKTNYIFKYRLRDRNVQALARLSGVITIAQVSPNGKYLVIKMLVQGTGIIPKGEMAIVNIKSGKIKKLKSSYAFLDFSIAPEGNSIIFENSKGIIELSLDTGIQRNVLGKKYYKDIIISNNPVLARISPDRQRILVLNGSGGNYKAKIFRNNGKQISINNISSSSEIFWLDNFTIAYRTGYSGSYSVVLYNLQNNKTVILLKNSFNTNICYSIHAGFISFLKEQVIFLYDRSREKIINTGLEGEDISFEPNGNRFVTLLFKKLFIVNLSKLSKKRIELKRSWRSILLIYQDLKDKKSDFENQYSRLYIERKIRIYSGLTDI